MRDYIMRQDKPCCNMLFVDSNTLNPSGQEKMIVTDKKLLKLAQEHSLRNALIHTKSIGTFKLLISSSPA